MMKKTYTTPVVDVKRFDVADIITISEGTPATVSADITGNGEVIEIVAKW